MEILEIVTLLMSSHGKNHDMLKGMLSEACWFRLLIKTALANAALVWVHIYIYI